MGQTADQLRQEIEQKREDAAQKIAENYLRFVEVYKQAEREPAAA